MWYHWFSEHWFERITIIWNQFSTTAGWILPAYGPVPITHTLRQNHHRRHKTRHTVVTTFPGRALFEHDPSSQNNTALQTWSLWSFGQWAWKNGSTIEDRDWRETFVFAQRRRLFSWMSHKNTFSMIWSIALIAAIEKVGLQQDPGHKGRRQLKSSSWRIYVKTKVCHILPRHPVQRQHSF